MEEAGEAGRAVATRLRLQASLEGAERAVLAAAKGLAFHRVGRQGDDQAARRGGPALQVQVAGVRRAAPAREAVTATMRGAALPAGEAGPTSLPSAAGASAAWRAFPAPGGNDIDRRGASTVPAVGRQRPPAASGAATPSAGGAMNRLKLTWHDGMPAKADGQTPNAMPARPGAGAAAPGAKARERGGAAAETGRGDTASGWHNGSTAMGAAAAAPIAGGVGDGAMRALRAAMAQAGMAQAAIAQTARGQAAPGLRAAKADARPSPARQALAKAVAPARLTGSSATSGPAASGSPPPELSGRYGVSRASQAAGPQRDRADTPDGGAGDRQGPAQGDVYLDGTLVGRWMARALTAQAGRPANGSAGFDPRRNVFPTGAMIGG